MIKSKKLTIRRQTIRTLAALDLAQARGGQLESEATCGPTTRVAVALDSEETCGAPKF